MNLWLKIKEKIISFFNKNKIKQLDAPSKETIPVRIEPNISINKEEFMSIYSKVKENKIKLEDLDKNVLYKVLIMLNEEIQLTVQNSRAELNKVYNCIGRLKVKENRY